MDKRFVLFAGGIAFALAGASVGAFLLFGGPGGETAASTTTPAFTTTSGAGTTAVTGTGPSTTTSPVPGATVALNLEGEGPLQQAARDFYAWLGDREGVEAPAMAEGLAAFIADVTVAADLELTGEYASAALADGAEVAVVAAAEDVLLLADEGQGWRVVGARLASLGLEAWYGDPVRFVMVIGTDARPGEDEPLYRGDSLHILTSNIGAGAGAVVGFPRDSW